MALESEDNVTNKDAAPVKAIFEFDTLKALLNTGVIELMVIETFEIKVLFNGSINRK
jgi:hypothetical protein